MKHKAMILLLVWGALTLAAWFSPEKALSVSERRPLAGKPELSAGAVFSGNYMEDFEDYSLDQFPFRDSFRRLKAWFHYSVLGQRDNNGIYVYQGYAAKQEYPLNETSVAHALNRFQTLYETYLTQSNVYMAVVPDKGYYLAEQSGHLAMDYDRLYELVEIGMPWAAQVDLRDSLSAGDYYRTDTHWRQEKLLDAAGVLCQALGIAPPKAEDYTRTALERPFYGVYYGQAALPMEPDTLYLLESTLLENCTVYDYETGKTGSVYDRNKLESQDLYDVFLSGARSLLTIENPDGDPDRELIVFRDSFGSSMVPLLVQGYGKVTLVDIRYIRMELLGEYLDFAGKDVLLLYSTLVLNNSAAIK
ncbi:MAG: DHHW family protein [Faecousia sp.]